MPRNSVNTQSVIIKRDIQFKLLKRSKEELETILSLNLTSTAQETLQEVKSRYKSVEEACTKVEESYLATPDSESNPNQTAENDNVMDQSLTIWKECMEKFSKFMSHTQTTTSHAMTDKSTERVNDAERLPAPSWTGSRLSYATWKKEFQEWIVEHKQSERQALQRLRKALPAGTFWADQALQSPDITAAWAMLDTEFGCKVRLIDEITSQIDRRPRIGRKSGDLSRFALEITSFLNNMKNADSPVAESSETSFIMARLRSKIDPDDQAQFGRDADLKNQQETVKTLVEWLRREAVYRARKEQSESPTTPIQPVTTRNNFVCTEVCPYGCEDRHYLAGCPKFKNSDVTSRWKYVRENKLCSKCLKTGHQVQDCRKPDRYCCESCPDKEKHHKILHPLPEVSNLRSSKCNATPHESNLRADAPNFIHQSHQQSAQSQGNSDIARPSKPSPIPFTGICPIQKVRVITREGHKICLTALLDTGADHCLISTRTARKLGNPGHAIQLSMKLASGRTASTKAESIELLIDTNSGPSVTRAFAIPKPCANVDPIPRRLVSDDPALSYLAEELYLEGGAIDLVIGVNFWEAFLDTETVQSTNGLIAKKNCLGWYLLGSSTISKSPTLNVRVVKTTDCTEDQIKQLVTQDQLGVAPTALCTCSDNQLKETKFIEFLRRNTSFVDGRLQIKLPWKDGPPSRSNYGIAVARLKNSLASFYKKQCIQSVNEAIQELLEADFVRVVPAEEIDHRKPEWYLPLQVVFTPDKSTTVRLVFDASSKGHDGRSLNDYLEKGPNYLNQVVDVMCSWRWDKIAYTGDIRKMFNQVVLHQDDRQFHRFIWNTSDEPPTVYEWKRLNFGDKPAPDVAIACIRLLAEKYREIHPVAATELVQSSYMDDIGGSKPSADTATEIVHAINEILHRGQFSIKTWHSNSSKVNQNDAHVTDFLGHVWNKNEDTISLKRTGITEPAQFTKRACLSAVSQLWDPNGILLSCTIKYRIHLQHLWSMGFDWDQVLPKVLQDQWHHNVEEMNRLLQFECPRRLKPDGAVGDPEIHGFSDGGELAYGAVIYLQWTLKDGSFHVVPVMCKAFVAPLKTRSIPRIELMAMLTLARMYTTITSALKFAAAQNFKTTFWIDSLVVLHWIRRPPVVFRPFVSVRVAEIQDSINVSDVRYVDTHHNIADALTRGIDSNQLKLWMEGPPFLRSHSLPDFTASIPITAPLTSELQELKHEKHEVVSNAVATAPVVSNAVLSHLTTSISSFSKIRRVLAYALRFIKNTKAKVRNQDRTPEHDYLSVEEIRKAERLLIRWTQQDLPPDKRVKAKEFHAELDEHGILRAHGRLETIRSLPPDVRNPTILPAHHPVTVLILHHLHAKRYHCGHHSLLYEARRRYWIYNDRSMAKELTRKCVTCRKLRQRPLGQQMGQLPENYELVINILHSPIPPWICSVQSTSN